MTRPIIRWNWTAGETVFEIRQWGAAYEVSYKGPLSGSTDVAGIVGEELIRLTKRIDELERVTRTLQSVCDSQAEELENLRIKPAEEPSAEDLYHELLYAVGMKHPGETRHQTALRYIRQAEEMDGEPCPRTALGMEKP